MNFLNTPVRSALAAGLAVILTAAGAATPAAGGPRTATPVPPDRGLTGHTDGVTAVSFFPDGVRVATCGFDRSVRVWDARRGVLLQTFDGHEGAVLAVAVSPDGGRVASGGADRTVRVWDAKTAELVGLLEGHRGDVRGVAWLPDGRLLTGAQDGLRVWDPRAERLLWKPEPSDDNAVQALAVSADGKRAAVLGSLHNQVQAWDLAAGRRVGSFGGRDEAAVAAAARAARAGGNLPDKPFLGLAVAISPDGKRVYAEAETKNHDFAGWDFDTGKPVPAPAQMKVVQAVRFFPDGRRAVVCEGGRIGVWDATTWEPLQALGGAVESWHHNGAAVSPDGQTVVVCGGEPRAARADESVRPARLVWVYSLPNAAAAAGPGAAATPGAAALGPAEGKVSWEVIPVSVKTKDGRAVPLTRLRYPAEPFDDVPDLRARALAPGLDVLWGPGVVLLHGERGVLREALVDARGHFTDVVWDGANVWVAASNDGVVVLDRTGKELAFINREDGLPASEGVLLLYPLAPGRVLAAGVLDASSPRKGSGWCAIIERKVDAPPKTPGKVTVVLKEPQLPAGWYDAGRPERFSTFVPKWIAEAPAPAPKALPAWVGVPAGAGAAAGAAAKPARSIWIACSSPVGGPSPVLRLDAETLAATAYNLEPAPAAPPAGGRPPARTTLDLGRLAPPAGPYWLNDREMLFPGDGGAVYAVPLGDKSVDRDPATFKTIIPAVPGAKVRPGSVAVLSLDGQFFVPGPRWRRIDAATLKVEDLGPGLRVDGKLVTDRISYFVSGHLGLAAFSKLDGCLYRFSVDPAHPAPVRATADVPGAPAPAAPGGAKAPS